MYSCLKFKEGLISDREFLPKWLNENQQKVSQDFVVTPQMAHYATLIRRIHHNSNMGTILEGKICTGKSNFLNFYRQAYHHNSYYTHIHAS